MNASVTPTPETPPDDAAGSTPTLPPPKTGPGGYSAAERRRLAELAGVDEQFLYQCFTGKNRTHPQEAVRIERCTGIPRWKLRVNDWWTIWPELVGTAGAPALPDAAIAEWGRGPAESQQAAAA